MAVVSLTIPDADIPRVIATAAARGYPNTGAGAKQLVIDLVKRAVHNYERAQELQQAADSFDTTNVDVVVT